LPWNGDLPDVGLVDQGTDLYGVEVGHEQQYRPAAHLLRRRGDD
jgi:hypothetical protein